MNSLIEWITQYWYIVVGVGGSALYVAWQVRNNKSNVSTGKKVLFSLAPALDPDSDTRRSMTPRAALLALVGVILALLANLVVYLLS